MKRKLWGLWAALLGALLLFGACSAGHSAQYLLFGFGGAAVPGAAVTLREPAYVDYTVARYSYRDLSPVQQQAYRIVYNAVASQPERIVLPLLTEEQLSQVMTALKFENPHVLCMDTHYSYCAAGSACYVFPEYKDGVSGVEERTEKLMQAAKRILAAAPLGDPCSLELYLHDAVCSGCVYGDSPWADTAYGALVEGRAECGGYTAAAKLLFDMAGLESAVVSGKVRAGEGEDRHLWNAVSLNGAWYYTDLTWDDPVGSAPRHDYFNVSEAELAKTHFGYSAPAALRVTGGSDDFYRRNGLYCAEADWQRVLERALAAAIDADGVLEVKFAGESLYKRAQQALFAEGLLQTLTAPYFSGGGTVGCSYSGSADVCVLHIALQPQA